MFQKTYPASSEILEEWVFYQLISILCNYKIISVFELNLIPSLWFLLTVAKKGPIIWECAIEKWKLMVCHLITIIICPNLYIRHFESFWLIFKPHQILWNKKRITCNGWYIFTTWDNFTELASKMNTGHFKIALSI